MNIEEFSGGSESDSEPDSNPRKYKKIQTGASDSVQTRLNKLGIHNIASKNGENVIDMSVLKQDNDHQDNSIESEILYPTNQDGGNNYAWQPSRKLAHHSSEDEDKEDDLEGDKIRNAKTRKENMQDVLIVQGDEANLKAKSLRFHK